MSKTKQIKDVQPGEQVLYRLKWYSYAGYSDIHGLALKDSAGKQTLHKLPPKAAVHVKAEQEQDEHPIA